MQVYRELRVLTARPSPAEEARVPHRLYGVRARGRGGQRRVVARGGAGAMEAARAAGRADPVRRHRPVFRGAHPAASPTSPILGRPRGRRRGRCWPKSARPRCTRGWPHVDPRPAARLRADDSQRIARAWEVWRGTGTRPGRVAGAAGGASAVAFRRDPARPATRGAAGGDRRRGSPRCWSRARSRRCGRCWPSASIRRCRRCGRTACRNCPPICAATSRWRKRRAGRTGHRAIHEAPGDVVPPSPARHRQAAHIRSMRDMPGSAQFSERDMADL